MQTPVAAFVDDMAKFGLCPRVEAELVVCDVTPAAGAYAGGRVEAGVAAAELGDWPHAPPHWVHLPDAVVFNSTNSKASPRAGWLQHSRNCAGWGDAPAAVCWHAHLQAVLNEAVR